MIQCIDNLELSVLGVLNSDVSRAEIYWMCQARDARTLFC